MVLQDLLHILETWAPKQLAWERDNVGLQVGSAGRKVRKVLVALDVTDTVIDEARKKNIDVIVSHHPLIFRPITTLQTNDRTGRLLSKLVKADIALYALHTNLDFTSGGVSFSLAGKLRLRHISVLHRHFQIEKKIIVYVPEEHAQAVIAAMAEQGAGIIGNYAYCSFRTRGTGTYKPGEHTHPYAGKAGKLESADEVRLEMIAPEWRLGNILGAMRSAHPYEEVAYDVYDLANVSNAYGAGAIGELEKPMPLQKFLTHVKRSLGVPLLRYAAGSRRTIRRVAVCGGSGSDLVQSAIEQGAGAYITADVTYHKFQDSDGKITLVDAGHFETERPALQSVVRYIADACAARKENIQVSISATMHNFVQYSLA